jgi:hypothetical protein
MVTSLFLALAIATEAQPTPSPTPTPRPKYVSETYGRKLPQDFQPQGGPESTPEPSSPSEAGSLAGLAAHIKLRRSAGGGPITNANLGSMEGSGTPELYRLGFLSKAPEVISTHREIEDIFAEIYRDPKIWKTAGWAARLKHAEGRFHAAIEHLNALTPPSTEKAAHEKLIEGLSEIDRGVAIAVRAAEANDESAVAPGVEAVRRGNRLCTEAVAALGGHGERHAQGALADDSEYLYDAPAIIKTHCEGEWPSDYRMRQYCIEKQEDGLAELRARSFSDGLSASVLLGIRSKCKADWPTDYRMRNYCEAKQVEAYRKLNP